MLTVPAMNEPTAQIIRAAPARPLLANPLTAAERQTLTHLLKKVIQR
jgi:hypothetical protein